MTNLSCFFAFDFVPLWLNKTTALTESCWAHCSNYLMRQLLITKADAVAVAVMDDLSTMVESSLCYLAPLLLCYSTAENTYYCL